MTAPAILDLARATSDVGEGREPAKKPARRWRNKWWHGEPVNIHGDDGIYHCEPGIRWARRVWPTLEIAEQKAMAILAMVRPDRKHLHLHLGSFPESAP